VYFMPTVSKIFTKNHANSATLMIRCTLRAESRANKP